MISRGVDYLDANVAAAREQDFRTEFIRSLVYSSQVVIRVFEVSRDHVAVWSQDVTARAMEPAVNPAMRQAVPSRVV
jgi:hypothetical protein